MGTIGDAPKGPPVNAPPPIAEPVGLGLEDEFTKAPAEKKRTISDRHMAGLLTKANKAVSHAGQKIGALTVPDDVWDALEPELTECLKTYAPSLGKWLPWVYIGLSVGNIGSVCFTIYKIKKFVAQAQAKAAINDKPRTDTSQTAQGSSNSADEVSSKTYPGSPEDMDTFLRANRDT